MVVESMAAASHPVFQVVDPTKPATQPKRVTARGWGGSCPMTRPHACKVTHFISPSPEATIAAPPVAGPSQMAQLPLFEEPAVSGGNEVGPGGQCHWVCTTIGHIGVLQLTPIQFL